MLSPILTAPSVYRQFKRETLLRDEVGVWTAFENVNHAHQATEFGVIPNLDNFVRKMRRRWLKRIISGEREHSSYSSLFPPAVVPALYDPIDTWPSSKVYGQLRPPCLPLPLIFKTLSTYAIFQPRLI